MFNHSTSRNVDIKIKSGDFEKLANQYEAKLSQLRLNLKREIGMYSQVAQSQSEMDGMWLDIRADILKYEMLLAEVNDSFHSAVTGR
jgi:hypothetical protein